MLAKAILFLAVGDHVAAVIIPTSCFLS